MLIWMDSYASYNARRHCPMVVCTLPMLLILDVSFPEASRALGSGGLDRSDVDLGGPLMMHSIARRHCSRRECPPSFIGMCAVSVSR
jgi:hypothetical protein